jgi:hypothetical protein
MVLRSIVELSAVRADRATNRDREVFALICLALLLAIVALGIRLATTL